MTGLWLLPTKIKALGPTHRLADGLNLPLKNGAAPIPPALSQDCFSLTPFFKAAEEAVFS